MNCHGAECVELYVTPAGTANACITGKCSVMISAPGRITYHIFDRDRGWVKHRSDSLPAVIHPNGQTERWEYGIKRRDRITYV